MFEMIGLGLAALALPAVISVFTSWAWGERGVAVSIAMGPVLAILIVFSRFLAATISGTAFNFHFFPLSTTALLITVIWLLACIPGVVVGLAIRSIAKQRRMDAETARSARSSHGT
jgi:Mg2+/Co2+ transporter CorB